MQSIYDIPVRFMRIVYNAVNIRYTRQALSMQLTSKQSTLAFCGVYARCDVTIENIPYTSTVVGLDVQLKHCGTGGM